MWELVIILVVVVALGVIALKPEVVQKAKDWVLTKIKK